MASPVIVSGFPPGRNPTKGLSVVLGSWAPDTAIAAATAEAPRAGHDMKRSTLHFRKTVAQRTSQKRCPFGDARRRTLGQLEASCAYGRAPTQLRARWRVRSTATVPRRTPR